MKSKRFLSALLALTIMITSVFLPTINVIAESSNSTAAEITTGETGTLPETSTEVSIDKTGAIDTAIVNNRTVASDWVTIYSEATICGTESMYVELYCGNELLATTTLVDNDKVLLNGETNKVTYHFFLVGSDDWWKTEWVENNPVANKVPNKVALYVDGKKTGENEVVMSNSNDNLGDANITYNFGDLDGVKVAEVNGNYYDSLQEAVNEAEAEQTVTILGSFSEKEIVKVTAGKNVIIDFGGNTLYGSMLVEKGATADIKNGSIAQTDVIAGIEVQGVTTLTNMNITSARHAIRVDGLETEGTMLTVNGGTYQSNAPAGWSAHAINAGEGSTVIINGGTFIGAGLANAGGTGNCVMVKDHTTTVEIKGGTFYGSNGPEGVISPADKLTISGGSFGTWSYDNYLADGYTAVEVDNGIEGTTFKVVVDVVELTHWIQIADTKWYNDNDTEFTIDTAEELAGLAVLVNGGNSFSGKTINLGADIVLAGLAWTPIGNATTGFRGTFDGNGKTISNLTASGTTYVGLFGNAGAGDFAATIKDLTLNNVNVSGTNYVGALVGNYVGKIENCHIIGSVAVNGNKYVGGIVGASYGGTVANSTIKATTEEAGVVNASVQVGGIIGMSQTFHVTGCTVENITISANPTSGGCIGGIVGQVQTGAMISDNTVSNVTINGGIEQLASYGPTTGLIAGYNISERDDYTRTYVINNVAENVTATANGETVTNMSGNCFSDYSVVGTGVVLNENKEVISAKSLEICHETALAEGSALVKNEDGTYTVGKVVDISNGLDLTAMATNSGEGWAWNAETKTLTLSGVTINTATSPAIKASAGTTIILTDGSVNTITTTGARGIESLGSLIIKTADGYATKGTLNINTGASGSGIIYRPAAALETAEDVAINISDVVLNINGAQRGIEATLDVAVPEGTAPGVTVTLNNVTLTDNSTDRSIQVYSRNDATLNITDSTVNATALVYVWGKTATVMNITDSTVEARKIKLGWWNSLVEKAELNVTGSTMVITNMNGSDAAIEVGVNFANEAKATLTDSTIIAANNKSAAISVSEWVPAEDRVGVAESVWTQAARGELTITNCDMTLVGTKDYNDLTGATVTGTNNITSVVGTTVTVADGVVSVTGVTSVTTDGKTYTPAEGSTATVNQTTGKAELPDAPAVAATINGVAYSTLQAAMDAAVDGDTINIFAGTYDAFYLPKADNVKIIGATNEDGTPAVTILAQSGTQTRNYSHDGFVGEIINIRFETVEGYTNKTDTIGQFGALALHDEAAGNPANATFTNCEFIRQGVHFLGVANFYGCTFDGQGVGYSALNYCCPSGDIVIKDCTFSGYTFASIHLAEGNGDVTIENCTITSETGKDNYLELGSPTNVSFIGGSINAVINLYGEKNATLEGTAFGVNGIFSDNEWSSGDDMIVVYPGTTFAYDPTVGENAVTPAEGFKIEANGDGTFGVEVAETYVAEVNGIKYTSLQEAINAANANDVIVLLGNVTETGITVAVDKTVTIDLNGNTVYGSFVVYGTATIKNGTIDSTACGKSGIETNNESDRSLNPTLVAENLTIVSGRHAIRVDGGTVTINGGSYTAADAASNHAVNISSGKVTIENGTFIGNTQNGSASVAIRCDVGTSELVINDGTFTGGHSSLAALTVWSGCTATVNGGTFESVYCDSAVTVTGGTFDEVRKFVAGTSITGGSFKDYNPACNTLNGTVHNHSFVEGKIGVLGTDGYYTLVEGAYVAQTETQCFATLAEAMDEANGATVTLIADITITEKTYVKADLDLNGYTVTVNSTGDGLYVRSAVTIKGGKIVSVSANGQALVVSSDTVLDNMIIEGTSKDGLVRVINSACLTVNENTSINATGNTIALAFTGRGEVLLNGTVTAPDGTAISTSANTSGKLDINEGAVISGTNALYVNGGDVNLNGGTYTGALSIPEGIIPNITKADAAKINAPAGYDWMNGTLIKIDLLSKLAVARYYDEATAKYKFTILSGLDSLSYSEVGFIITIGGKTVTLNIDTVFESVNVTVNGEPTLIEASKFSSEADGFTSDYIFGVTITFELDFAKENTATFRSYAVTADGETVYGYQCSDVAIYK